MKIDNRTLVGSLENIIRKAKEAPANPTSHVNSKASAPKSTPVKTVQHNQLDHNLVELNKKQRNLQNDYTREQMRLALLNDEKQNIHSSIEYEGKKLFPELANNDTQLSAQDREVFRNTASSRVVELLHNLKGLQVEIENIYALRSTQFTAEENRGKTELSQEEIYNSKHIAAAKVKRLLE